MVLNLLALYPDSLKGGDRDPETSHVFLSLPSLSPVKADKMAMSSSCLQQVDHKLGDCGHSEGCTALAYGVYGKAND